MEEFTYEQIRAKALKQGVKDNKVHIGLWANLNNYLKTRRKKNGKVSTYYNVSSTKIIKRESVDYRTPVRD